MIEADFASEYGLILADHKDRSARWFTTMLAGLLAADTRIARALRAD